MTEEPSPARTACAPCWREKKPAFGAIATMPSVQAVQIIAAGLDWIVVDLEHGADRPFRRRTR